METLNYNHLHYFWVVAHEGSIAAASKRLDVAPPTISAQLRDLERSLGERLFERVGRGLVLTDVGRVAFRHAEEMFLSGQALLDAVRGRSAGRPIQLVIGVADQLPKLVAYRLIKPALELPDPVQFRCRDGRTDLLIAELAIRSLDVVLSDTPIGTGLRVRAFDHLLGECGVAVVGTESLAARHRPGFPGSLDGAPCLLPPRTTALRRELDRWFDDRGLRPEVRGEVDDSALLKVFGSAGEGLCFVPSVIEAEVCRQYSVKAIGRLDEVRERFYAISVERRLQHPAVLAITEAARRELFA
ncbi:MAG: transcriptional activator NhaR [Isosphaeraceae bacterium]